MTTYTAIQGETWDMIAYKLYKNEHAMQMLLNANVELSHMRIFKGGEQLTIPDVAEVSTTITPPWSK